MKRARFAEKNQATEAKIYIPDVQTLDSVLKTLPNIAKNESDSIWEIVDALLEISHNCSSHEPMPLPYYLMSE